MRLNCLFLFFWGTALLAGAQSLNNRATSYSLQLNSLYTGSGHGWAEEVGLAIDDDIRSFNLGLMIDPLGPSFTGGEAKLKIYLYNLMGRSAQSSSYGAATVPFVFYTIKYRLHQVNMMGTGYADMGYRISEPVDEMVQTVEQYIGVGYQFKFDYGIYADVMVGFGPYFSSFYENKYPKTLGFHNDYSGWNMDFELTLGYWFY